MHITQSKEIPNKTIMSFMLFDCWLCLSSIFQSFIYIIQTSHAISGNMAWLSDIAMMDWIYFAAALALLNFRLSLFKLHELVPISFT